MLLFLASRVKQLCFLSLENCGERGDPISPVEFQVMDAVFLAVEEHRVSNVNVEEQDER